MRLKIIIILLIVIHPVFAKNDYKQDVDSLNELSYNKFTELQFIESMKLANKALHIATESKYEKGITYSNLYIAKVLQETGLRIDALKLIEKIEDDKYFKKDPFVQAETYRLKGRIASYQHLYSFEKENYLKQLKVSKNIIDRKKRELSVTTAYFYIQHMYVKQNNLDSAVVYQDLLKESFDSSGGSIGKPYYIALYADKGLLYKNIGKFDDAAKELDKSLQFVSDSNSSLLFYILQIYGDLEAARGDTVKAISHYKSALKHSINLGINHKTMYLHKKISDCLIHDELTINKAKNHLRAYNIISDSLERYNKMVVDFMLNEIIKDKDAFSAQKRKLFRVVIGILLFISISTGAFLIFRNEISKKKLIKRNQQLVSTTEKVELLEEELESNIFNDIIELAKSNSPEFLPLFGEGCPEFVEALKQLDPNIRSSELYFCALAYLNFSTKDIANFTFVTIRAVQVRKNRMRKKYDIPSEVDFNEWFRSLGNGDVSVN